MDMGSCMERVTDYFVEKYPHPDEVQKKHFAMMLDAFEGFWRTLKGNSNNVFEFCKKRIDNNFV